MKQIRLFFTLVAFMITFIFGMALSHDSETGNPLWAEIFNYYSAKTMEVKDDFDDMASNIEFYADGVYDAEYNINNNYFTMGETVVNGVSTRFKIEKEQKNLNAAINHKIVQVIDGVTFTQQHSSQHMRLKNDWFVAKNEHLIHYFAMVDSIDGERLTSPTLLELVEDTKLDHEAFVGISVLEVIDATDWDDVEVEFISKGSTVIKFGEKRYIYKNTKWSAYRATH